MSAFQLCLLVLLSQGSVCYCKATVSKRKVDCYSMLINPSRLSHILLRLAAAALLLAALLSAQTDTAGLFGLVKDATGGAIVGSKVKLQSRATGAAREQVTDQRGLYQFEVL